MEFTGKIVKILPTRSGVSKSGKEWKSTSFVVENNEGRYPEGYVFETFNDLEAKEGDRVSVLFDGRAREWEGKYFNSLNAYKVTRIDGMVQDGRGQDPKSAPAWEHTAANTTAPGAYPTGNNYGDESAGLPF